MTVPLVSVLLTAFNRESYLAASIESVLAQTCGDFELIVVDDRSTDGTIDIAR
ncbi:MAG: glycosyltransferase, partial [Betaproteobacteria bacterium]